MSEQPADTYGEYKSVMGRVAILTRHRGADDPEVVELRARAAELRPAVLAQKDAVKRDLAAAKLQAHVERVVRMAVPLTDEQRDRIAAILTGTR